ncbi:MAG: KOW domain-containing RNA-binding protein [Clostridia bacterium]
MEPKPGQIVLSKAGRDKGKYFFVLSMTQDGQFVFVADGNLRKVDNPKKKKIKHVDMTDKESEKIARKVAEGKSIQNAEIAKELKLLMKDEEELTWQKT